MKITVLGAGSWGIALARLLNDYCGDVTLWSIEQDEGELLNQYHEHIEKLPGVLLSESILITNDMERAIKDSDILVFAVPSLFVRNTAQLLKPFIHIDQILVSGSKGLEAGTLLTLQEVIRHVLPDNEVVVLSGPCQAQEVARNIRTAAVVASKNEDIRLKVEVAFRNEAFSVNGCKDVLGVEIGGALIDVIGLVAGISDGLGFGDNTKAALMTMGMVEISRLGVAMGADPTTFNGLAGIGDLIVTCTSIHNINRCVGALIGQGVKLKEALDQVKLVVEGVCAAAPGLHLAKRYGVEMPMIEKVNQILFEDKNPREAILELLCRDEKIE